MGMGGKGKRDAFEQGRDNDPRNYRAKLFTALNYGLLLIILALAIAVRIRLLGTPLERDEGEYAYMGQLILQGIPPFANAYSMKLPGVALGYATFMAMFGQTITAIHLGLLIINLVSIVLVWAIASELFGRESATPSAALYAILSLSQGVLGIFAHATHFAVMFVLLGLWLMLRHIKTPRGYLPLLSGLSFGLALLMKQHVIPLVFFAGCYLLFRRFRKPCPARTVIGEAILFGVAFILPFTVVMFWLWSHALFEKFKYWTIDYAREYVSGIPLADGVGIFWHQFTAVFSFQWPILLAALAGLLFSLLHRERETDRFGTLGFLLAAFLAISPGFYFREHYFVLILPFVAMLAGYGLTFSGHLVERFGKSPLLGRLAPWMMLLILAGYGYHKERLYFFDNSPQQVSRNLYGANPFLESPEVASYIQSHSSPSDRIMVFGSEPQIYFYARRISSSGHIYMYPLMEGHPYASDMQKDLAREVENRPPLFIVFANVTTSWLFNSASSDFILHWMDGYIDRHCKLDGIADIFKDHTSYAFGDDASQYRPSSNSNVTVWKCSSSSAS